MSNGPWGSMIEREPDTPERSLKQRLDALAHANVVRKSRAQAKCCWRLNQPHPKFGRPSDVIADPPDEFATMKVVDLMLALPKYGRVKVNKSLQACGVSPSKTIGGLSYRQRAEILAKLTGR